MVLFTITYDALKAHLLKRAAYWSVKRTGIVDIPGWRPDNGKAAKMAAFARRLQKPIAPGNIDLTLAEFEAFELDAEE